MSMLNVEKIQSKLINLVKDKIQALMLLGSVDSTNTYLLNHPQLKTAEKSLICIADMQTQGRGRQGKAWVSPPNANLYFSLAWPCRNMPPHFFSALSVITGLVVATVLEKMSVVDIKLKWPNDIVWHGKKLGGILLESSGISSQPHAVVIGIGLNIAMSENNVIDQPWIDLQTVLSKHITREEVAVQLINALIDALMHLENYHDNLVARWERFDVLRDKHITVKTYQENFSGIARGITPEGQLKLEIDNEIVLFSSGEIMQCRG